MSHRDLCALCGFLPLPFSRGKLRTTENTETNEQKNTINNFGTRGNQGQGKDQQVGVLRSRQRKGRCLTVIYVRSVVFFPYLFRGENFEPQRTQRPMSRRIP